MALIPWNHTAVLRHVAVGVEERGVSWMREEGMGAAVGDRPRLVSFIVLHLVPLFLTEAFLMFISMLTYDKFEPVCSVPNKDARNTQLNEVI